MGHMTARDFGIDSNHSAAISFPHIAATNRITARRTEQTQRNTAASESGNPKITNTNAARTKNANTITTAAALSAVPSTPFIGNRAVFLRELRITILIKITADTPITLNGTINPKLSDGVTVKTFRLLNLRNITRIIHIMTNIMCKRRRIKTALRSPLIA